ncbi:nucleotidyltransferase family protein (plasmid) [Sulfitobacter sp. W027]|uniref:nucleotidyltransferase family protein n=1 Tax=Sulfitobacter sp. W027 TaxID=2867025 RepID=UPI0021A2B93C|nr:nucleotidyltransferase family protein [Sulfitobacter sp. W027]UWR35721.1 nucleotidyltransferase family protein [Sulfitobacter sp. W027]
MLTDLKKMTVQADASLRRVMEVIDSEARQIALVTDDIGVLVATVTDGDVRRGLLQGVQLDTPVSEIMHRNPTTLLQGASAASAQRLMRERGLHHIPVVDAGGRLVALALREGMTGVEPRPTRVLLMAGGLGMRLRPLTETVPKPMIPVGDKPLLERIVTRFQDQGFSRFTLSLNYLGQVIRDYFGDGSRLGVEIDYVEETKRMGTGGALSLMLHRPDEPFVVMNGDILTTTSFGAMMDFHVGTGSAVTICAREFNMQVPYGVLNTEGTTLMSMEEKPVHRHLVNAGIYALSPLVFDHVKDGEPLDMPDLVDRVKEAGHQVSVFPVREYWMDIGRIEDLDRARAEYETVFGK